MKFELIDDFKNVYLKLWSVRFALIAGIFGGLEVILPLFEASFPRGIFAVISFLASIASAVARGIAQKKLYADK